MPTQEQKDRAAKKIQKVKEDRNKKMGDMVDSAFGGLIDLVTPKKKKKKKPGKVPLNKEKVRKFKEGK